MRDPESEEEAADLAAGAVKRRKLPLRKKLLFIAAMLVITSPLLAVALEMMLRILAPQPLLPRYVTDSGFGIRAHNANISIHHTTVDYRVASGPTPWESELIENISAKNRKAPFA